MALSQALVEAFVRPIVDSLRALVPEARQEVLDEVCRQVGSRPREPKPPSEANAAILQRVASALSASAEGESRGAIAKRADCTPEEATTALQRLVSTGTVIQEGTKRGATYRLASQSASIAYTYVNEALEQKS